MKVALLGDIHGNNRALSAVLSAVKEKNIHTLLITGDFVGYYFWPVEVFHLLESWNVVAVCGNHDKMLKKVRNDKNKLELMSDKYGSGLRIALEQLDSTKIDWLLNLPNTLEYEVESEKILLCHGSPWNADEYIYPDANNESINRYCSLNVKWVVQGHTHYPMKRKFENITVINPGSVGQPRNKEQGAQWALLDTESDKLEHFCEQYDSSEVVMESKKRHPEIPYLADVLECR